MHDPMDSDAPDIERAHELLREGGPTVFVGLLVCAGKEYIWGRVLRALLDQTLPLAKCHFHCIFDGPVRIAELWWEAFARLAEAQGATATSETVELPERHASRWINVGQLREIARQRFLATGCTHLWWVECDCPPPPNALSSLCAVNRPMVTAAVACRGNRLHWNHMRPGGAAGEPGDVDGIDLRDDEPPALLASGLGCCLMERAALASCGWQGEWWEEQFIGGEDGYIQGAVKHELGCELLLDPHVLVPHCDVAPRDPDGVIAHVPVTEEGATRIERLELSADESPGLWRPRLRPWTFTRRWRNHAAGAPVPEELREQIAGQYRWAMSGSGPQYPALDLAQHEVLLPGQRVRIGGLYRPVDAEGEAVGEPEGLACGEETPPGDGDVVGFDLTEITGIECPSEVRSCQTLP